MKKMIPYTASSLFLVFAVFLIGQKARPASLVDQWEEVEEATKKGLPKTAIEKLDPLIERALKEKAHAVAIRAIAQKINLEGAIEGNKPEEKIARMEAEMTKAPKELQPMMNAVLSNWYWQYFQRNRWRFTQRTLSPMNIVIVIRWVVYRYWTTVTCRSTNQEQSLSMCSLDIKRGVLSHR